LNPRSHGTKHVITVHAYVHERIQQGAEERLATGRVFSTEPPVEDHRAVVIDVEERHLVIFLAQNEKDRVGQIDDFREEIPPGNIGHPERERIDCEIDGLAGQVVSGQIGAGEELVKHVTGQSHLESIVNHQDPFQLKWLPVLHPARAQHHHA